MILHLTFLVLLLAIIYSVFRDFHSAVGTVWQRLLAAGKHSATILWARFCAAVASAADAVVWVCEIINAPSVATAVQTYLKPPVVATIMVAIAIITEIARRRTLPST
jgi:hypothetical protein